MLTLWLAWVLLVVPAFILGNRVLLLTAPLLDRVNATNDWNFVAIWLGILAIANILLLIASAGSLTPIKLGFVLLAATSIGLVHNPTRTRTREWMEQSFGWRGNATIGYVVVSLAVAFAAATPVYLFDTGLYHYPHIKWLATYGEVPGLSLLHDRFGLTTSWFTIPASLDHGIFAGRTSSLLNGFAFALLAFQIMFSIRRWLQGTDSSSDRFLVCAGAGAAAYALAVGLVNSASPDLPGIFLPAIVVWVSLRASDNRVPAVALLLALLLVTIKISSLPVVAATGLFVIPRQSWKGLVKWGAAATIVLLPILLASVITSGCLLFPVAATCMDFSWSPGADLVRNFADVVTDWARWAGPKPAQVDFAAWWTQWGARKSNLALALLLALSIAAGLEMRRRILEDGRMAFAAVLAIFGLCYVILLAPDFRFAAGYLVLLPALFIAHQNKKARYWHRVDFTARTATITLLLAIGSAFVLNIIKARHASFERLPASYPSMLSTLISPPKFIWLRGDGEADSDPDPATYIEETDAAFPYYRPVEGDRCWDIRLPCSNVRLSPNVTLRKPEDGLVSGFVRR